MKPPAVDPKRLAAELEADAEVLRALAENGDIAELVRDVDLHFKGAEPDIVALGDEAEDLGLEFIQFNEYEDGEWSVDFRLQSSIEPDIMARLTHRALEIELAYNVEYDGWGCAVQSGHKH